ncbi:MAG TPA: DUF2461 family protein [Terriglobia bacterium]|nr:DUF2461 family protein [Terriglobia bacterium]
MAGEFQGFTRDSFDFFSDLAMNNNTAWFKANRERYDRYVVGAFRGLLAALEPFLLNVDPHFETAGKTNGNFSRINRDIRFSKDKSPYKSNYYLYLYDGRHPRGAAGRFYVGLTADCVTAGFSIYGSPESKKRQREGKAAHSALESIFSPRVASHRNIFDRLLQNTVRKGRYETYWHRMEKGDWAQHSGLPKRDEDWQTLQAWVVRKVFLPKARAVGTPAFVGQVEKIIADLYPVYVFTSVDGPRWKNELKRKLS